MKFSVLHFRKFRKRQWDSKSVLICCTVVITVFYCIYINSPFFLRVLRLGHAFSEDNGGVIDLQTINYFRAKSKLLERKLLIDTEHCQIPTLDEWGEEINQQPFHDNSVYNCSIKMPRVTYVKGDNVIINSKLLTKLGYSLRSVSCCYRTVKRVNQKPNRYDKNADSEFRLSCDCKKMERVTRPTSRYIKVICNSRLLSMEPFSYMNFHALPLLHTEDDDGNSQTHEKGMKEKINFWKRCAENGEGAMETTSDIDLCKKAREFGSFTNVILIGIDSTSRMNFRRFLNKTVGLLESIGAIEMQGFTKVGHNTLPNFLPLSTSFSMDHIEKTCFTSMEDPFDDCPFIWKQFSKQKYITAHLEDAPNLAIFNFLKTGFVEQPTDIYIRPLMLAIYKHLLRQYSILCAGYQRPEEIVLNFVSDFVKSAASVNTPVFISTWLTDLTHEHMNSLEVMDDILFKTISKLDENKLLENTLLMVVGDHGYRFLPIRRTLMGWYEDRLPALWMHVPKSIQTLLPTARESVVKNSKQLLTPYDIHATLRHVLSLNENDGLSEEMFRVRDGISLFSEVPTRSCDDAHVPQQFCACKMPVKYESNKEVISNAAIAALDKINALLAPAPECEPLKLSHVYLSGVVHGNNEDGNNEVVQNSTSSDILHTGDSLLVGFVTTPGNFLFDSRVDYDSEDGAFTKVVNFVRTDQIQVFPKCVKNITPTLQELCVCKPT